MVSIPGGAKGWIGHWEAASEVRAGEGWLGVCQVLSGAGVGAGVWLSLTLPVPRSRMSPSPWRSLSCGHTVTSSTCAAWRPSCGAWMRGSGQLMGPSQPRASRWVLQGSGQRSREEWGVVPISFESGLTSGKTDGWLGSRVQYRPNVKGRMCIKGVK